MSLTKLTIARAARPADRPAFFGVGVGGLKSQRGGAHANAHSDVWDLIALWVCLMSGVASLLREGITLFFPTVAPSTQVFRFCALSCFIVSGWITLIRTRMRIRELIRELKTAWSPRHQFYFDLAKSSLEKRGDMAMAVLRHLRITERIVIGMHDVPN